VRSPAGTVVGDDELVAIVVCPQAFARQNEQAPPSKLALRMPVPNVLGEHLNRLGAIRIEAPSHARAVRA